MSAFDFFADESAATLDKAATRPSMQPEPGVWGGFLSGTANLTMQGFAKTARAIDLLGVIPSVIQDKLTGGTSAFNPLRMREGVNTENTDRYLAEHDATFNRAVDYWTPAAGEVGTAGRIAGSIIPTLAKVIISPALAVGSELLGTGEDLVLQGVDAHKALAVGSVQATGLGLGIWAPIFGSTLATRALVAGAGVNVAQGIVTKAASQAILSGDKTAEQFNPWDKEGLVIDALMGMAFGGLAHVSAKAAEANMTPTDKAAILTANQARHLEDTTSPGRPADLASATAHVEAVKKAVDDILTDRAVNVGQVVQDARFLPDVPREQAAAEVRAELARQARATVEEAMAAEQARLRAADTPGFLRTPEDLIALRDRPEFKGNADVARAIEIAQKSGALRTAEERIFLDSVMKERAFGDSTKPIEPLVRDTAVSGEGVIAEIQRGHEAALRVITERGEVPGAVESAAKGPVTFVYGEPGRGAKFKGGYGLSHIIAKHGEDVLGPVIETVVRGRVYREQGAKGGDPRVLLTHNGHTALLSLRRNGADEAWLLTGWDEERPGGLSKGNGSQGPTSPSPTLTRAGDGAGRTESITQDPLITEARQRASERPDMTMTDESGQSRSIIEMMDEANRGVEAAKADANLFQVAASCMVGTL